MTYKKLKCKLICYKNSEHLQQIYTGFSALAKNNLIELELEICKKKYSENSLKQHLLVILNNRFELLYDTHDSLELDEKMLSQVDYYFKRSYLSNYVTDRENKKKIKPLGLNYLLFPRNLDFDGFRRCVAFRQFGQAIKMLRLNSGFAATTENLESAPNYNLPPKVLFMVRAYDPHDVPHRPSHKIEERIANNEMRAKCIQMLRDEFGGSFYGGFSHTNFAIRKYKKYLLPNKNVSSKEPYLSLLKNFSICVATTGLHGSIGWKFAEYIALSKAIVSEKLIFDVPGNLEEGENYLPFDSAEECVHQVSLLFENQQLRTQIMDNNYSYYESFVRPDILVLNSLNVALLNE